MNLLLYSYWLYIKMRVKCWEGYELVDAHAVELYQLTSYIYRVEVLLLVYGDNYEI